jgi:RNA polymerase sigma-70 factor (ECF subfamily)
MHAQDRMLVESLERRRGAAPQPLVRPRYHNRVRWRVTRFTRSITVQRDRWKCSSRVQFDGFRFGQEFACRGVDLTEMIAISELGLAPPSLWACAPRLRAPDTDRVASAALRGRRGAPAERSMTQPGALAELDPAGVRAALAGDASAVERMVAAMTPIVQARVARALLRRSGSHGRDIQQEVADLTQEVFASLFSDDAKALRAWDPALGLSLANYVGLLAQRKVASIMRVRQRSPWNDEVASDRLDGSAPAPEQAPDAQAGSRELLQHLLARLQASLSPRGLELFYRLYVDEQSIEDVCAQTGLTADAVYQWKSRLGKAARTTLEELQRESQPPAASMRVRVAAGEDEGAA